MGTISGPKYIPYSYMEPLGTPIKGRGLIHRKPGLVAWRVMASECGADG